MRPLVDQPPGETRSARAAAPARRRPVIDSERRAAAPLSTYAISKEATSGSTSPLPAIPGVETPVFRQRGASLHVPVVMREHPVHGLAKKCDVAGFRGQVLAVEAVRHVPNEDAAIPAAGSSGDLGRRFLQ